MDLRVDIPSTLKTRRTTWREGGLRCSYSRPKRADAERPWECPRSAAAELARQRHNAHGCGHATIGTVKRSCDALIEEAEAAPIEGWDFTWLDGRATEERPSWGYSRLLAERVRDVSSLLDLQTGGGELLGQLPRLPPITVATEGWEPNVRRAAQRLHPRGAWVVVTQEDGPTLPFGSGTFELVVSRHPVVTCWDEVARVLRPGGRYLSQQIGPHSMREVTEFFMGPQPATSARIPELARDKATTAGLRVEDLRMERLRATFADVGAVVYYLRLVIWTVPDFSVDRYRDRLTALDREITGSGPFVAHSTRFLIEAAKPG